MQERKVVGSGKIIFPEGIKREDVAKKCHGCFFNVSCQGPEAGGGRVYAYVADEVSKPSDEEIEKKAACLKI